MALRKTNLVVGEYYHLYNRGNSKQKIFHDKDDYGRFVGLLYACNQRESFKIDNLKKDQGLFSITTEQHLVSIGAYCIMPNHFHILLTQGKNGDISKYMQKVITAYVMYYNKKYKRTGSLFEGKFKAQHANSDRYLKYLFSYIHLNPIKLIDPAWKEKGIRDLKKVDTYLKQYSFSSYLDYAGDIRVQDKLLDRNAFPKYFPKSKDFLKEIREWLNFNFSARKDLAEKGSQKSLK